MRRRSVLAGLGLVLAGPALAAPPALPFGGPFALLDQTGRPRTDAEFRGRFMLVYFGYTGCPDLCPLGLDTVLGAVEALGPAADRLQPILITVDPARDTPEALAPFVAGFGPRLLGLTGSELEIAAVAKAYRVHRRKVVIDPARPKDYLVDHGSLTYLMGPDGGCLTIFPHGTTAERMAEVVRRYVAEAAESPS